MSTTIRPGTTARDAVGTPTTGDPSTSARKSTTFRRAVSAALALGAAALALSVWTGAATVSSSEDPPSLSQHLYSGGPVNGWQ